MSMFCFQCEQTAKGTGCTAGGVCGKKADTANLQDQLTGELIALAKAANNSYAAAGKAIAGSVVKAVIDSLFTTITNVNFDDEAIQRQIEIVRTEKVKFPGNGAFDMARLWGANEDIRSLKSLLLFGMRGMAAYAHHAYVRG